MDKAKISLTWDELEQQLFTPKEIAEGKSNLKLSTVLKILDGLGYEMQIVKKRSSEFRETLNEQLKNPEFKKEWDLIQPELEKIRAECKKVQ